MGGAEAVRAEAVRARRAAANGAGGIVDSPTNQGSGSLGLGSSGEGMLGSWGKRPRAPSSPRARMRTSQIVWTAVLAGVAWLIRRLQQTGPSLINPPYCAWRFVGNHDAWNVAFPDMRSMYHVMQMNMDPGDEFKIVAESFPYARYMSYQTYELRRLMSQKSLRDVDIVPERGPNCYANLTAAVNGEKQGGYTLYITGHGDKNYTNELRALPEGVESGQFDVFFRIYVEESQHGPPQAPWGHLPAYGPELAYEWGWAPPPKVYVKRAYLGEDVWREVPFCQHRRRKGFKLLAYLSEMFRPPANPFPDDTPAGPNKQGNTFLPRVADRAGKFASKDANYVASVAEPKLHVDLNTTFLWSRVTGRLPTVPGSLYAPPYVANHSDYDVRYVSLSAVHRTVPFRNHATVSDTRIIEHYRARLPGGQGQHQGQQQQAWDGSYVIWVVPPEVDGRYPRQVVDEDAVVMKWGASIFDGKTIAHPGLLYRQVMAQSQVVGRELLPLHPSGVINIVPEHCGPDQPGPHAPGAAEAMASDDPARMYPYCCSFAAAMGCYMPKYVEHRMGPYYPKVQYFKGHPGDAELTLLDT